MKLLKVLVCKKYFERLSQFAKVLDIHNFFEYDFHIAMIWKNCIIFLKARALSIRWDFMIISARFTSAIRLPWSILSQELFDFTKRCYTSAKTKSDLMKIVTSRVEKMSGNSNRNEQWECGERKVEPTGSE